MGTWVMERFEFAGGATLTDIDILDRLSAQVATDGDDNLFGGVGDDTLDGGLGNDTLDLVVPAMTPISLAGETGRTY